VGTFQFYWTDIVSGNFSSGQRCRRHQRAFVFTAPGQQFLHADGSWNAVI